MIEATHKATFNNNYGGISMNSEQHAKNLVSHKEQDYSDKMEITKDSFSVFFDCMLRKLNERTCQQLSKKDIASMLGISPEIFRKYVNKEKVIKKRDCVIAICAMLQADTSDTNNALNIII